MGKAWSISLRLVGSAVVWIIIPMFIALGAANLFLSDPVVSLLEEKMQTDLSEWISSTEFSKVTHDTTVSFTNPTTDEKYNRKGSGWFSQVTRVGGKAHGSAWRSKSQSFNPFPISEIEMSPSPVRKNYSNAKELPLKALTRKVRNPHTGEAYYFSIFADVRTNIEDTEKINSQLRQRVIIASIILMAAIVIGVILQVRYGLKPLSDLRVQINNVKASGLKKVETDVAREIKPVVKALNDLFDYSDNQLERARVEVGNLAHSLKTPISIMRNEIRERRDEKGEVISAQLDNMERHVHSYLNSARAQVLPGDRANETPVFTRARPWQKIMESSHRDKEFKFTIDVPENHIFIGSHTHLDDVLENLIENACKWCQSSLRLTSFVAPHPITGRGQLSIVVEDDGPGIPEEQHAFVLGRGNRADEQTPGTGLGLDIVRRIATDYGGEIRFSTSKLGGLSVTVTLPGEAT